jgi:hypothetical protein
MPIGRLALWCASSANDANGMVKGQNARCRKGEWRTKSPGFPEDNAQRKAVDMIAGFSLFVFDCGQAIINRHQEAAIESTYWSSGKAAQRHRTAG